MNTILSLYNKVIKKVCKTCEAPIAYTVIFDEEKNTAQTPFNEDYPTLNIDDKIYGVGIHSNAVIFEISDLTLDKRTRDIVCSEKGNPIRHFVRLNLQVAGIDKKVLLCILNMRQNTLSESQIENLKDLTEQMNVILNLWKKETELTESQHELEVNTNLLDSFLSTTTHDLKSPIKSINSLIGLLKREMEHIGDKEALYFDLIQKSTEKALNLIASVIQFAQIREWKDKTVLIDTDAALNTIFNLVKINYPKKHGALELANLSPFFSNEDIFHAIFENLIDNAFKYSKVDTNLLIKITQNRKDGNWLFTVEDNGIGMEESNLKGIFEPFVRLHGASEYAGSGLGLTSVERAVNALGGKIWAESKLGIGTKFSFVIKIEELPRS